MAQLGSVPAIKAVKKQLDELKENGLVKQWELPYEEILTRLSAAVFFLTPAAGAASETIWKELQGHFPLQYQPNEEKKLSALAWRVSFSEGPGL